MSEDNKPALLEGPKTDFSQRDLEVIQKYVEAGTPGIHTVDDQKMSSILDMYLSGRTYRQIATTMQVQKQIVLYLSYKFNWFELRQDYLVDLEESIRARVVESKLKGQNFLIELQETLEKKIGANMSKYWATNNVEFADAIDLKEVDKYIKIMETLHKLNSDKGSGGNGSTPAVGLNLGEGVTIVKKGDNEVEITPKSKAIKDALKEFADFRREEEKKPVK